MKKLFKDYILPIIIFLVGYGILEGLRQAGILNPYYTQILVFIGINTILTIGLNLINGFNGQFSLGHAGFMAIGAYVSAYLTAKLHMPSFALALILGGLAAAFMGVVIGLPTLRLKGDYLAIATLGFGEIIRVCILNIKEVGAATGLIGIPKYTDLFNVLLITALVIIIARNFINSTHGRACISIREDEIAAEAMGINTTKYKVIAFAMGAFFAGVAGALFAHYLMYINPSSFTFMKSVEILVMVTLGGLGSITGSVVAAILLTILSEVLRAVGELRMIIYSALLIVLMLYRPQGLLGTNELSLDLLKKWFKKPNKKVRGDQSGVAEG